MTAGDGELVLKALICEKIVGVLYLSECRLGTTLIFFLGLRSGGFIL